MLKQTIIISLIAFITFAIFSCEKNGDTVQKVESVTLSPQTLTLTTGETAILQATVIPDGADIVWSSSNPSVAAVDDGEVFAGAITGTAIIKAQAGDKSASCTVTVIEEEEESYPLCYEVAVNIGIRTITTYPSEKDPAPKEESVVQISGTLLGTAVLNRIERLESEPDYWEALTGQGYVPVFTGNSDFKLRDENDYSNILFETRAPLNVSVKREEMDYILFDDGEKYVKIFDFLSEGANPKQAISLRIEPYSLDRTLNVPFYIVGLNILTYTEYLGDEITGNGHCLKWDYFTMQLEPSNDKLYFGILGEKTSTDPGEDVTQSPLIEKASLNNYFLNPAGGTWTVNLDGSSDRENSGTRTQSFIKIKLEFRSIQDVQALPEADTPPPPLEDWDWE